MKAANDNKKYSSIKYQLTIDTALKAVRQHNDQYCNNLWYLDTWEIITKQVRHAKPVLGKINKETILRIK